MIIYKATNLINSKVYIGASKYDDLSIRKKGHFRGAFKKNSQNYFHRALRKYGKENFKWEIIDTSNDHDELMKKEKFWVNEYNAFGDKGYNSCEGGGNTTGYKFSEESKRKIGEKASKRQIGENNPFYNKTHSDEQKLKWSKERKGRKLEGEWLKIIQKARKKNCKPVINLDTGEVFDSLKEAYESVGIKQGIGYVCRKKEGKAAGYRWMFYKDYLETNQGDTVLSSDEEKV